MPLHAEWRVSPFTHADPPVIDISAQGRGQSGLTEETEAHGSGVTAQGGQRWSQLAKFGSGVSGESLGAESLVGNPGPHPKSWALPGGILAPRSGTSSDGAK